MTAAPVLSALIVNWKSGAMTRALVENLRKQVFYGDDGEPGSLEVIVVDNASGADEEEHLAALDADRGVNLIRSAQNAGYGAAMNLAAEAARGRYVMMTNPDVMLFRGAVEALLNHLREADGCGLVGPRGYLDAQRFFLLPPVELPSLCELTSEGLARTTTSWGKRHARERSRRAVESWTATEPLSSSMISGFCMVMDADLARDLGPFDADYPFYFEDADLCLRLQRRGFTTDLVPRAEAVHFFNRSAGQAQAASMSRYEVSRRRFFKNRYSVLGSLGYGAYQLWTGSGHGAGHSFADVVDLGERETAPVLDVPGSGAYLAEISADPGFVFAAGRLDITRNFKIPASVWDGLVPATYYVRFLRRKDFEVIHMVSMTKVGESQPTDATIASAGLVHA